MLHEERSVGIFNTAYFPETTDDPSYYVSPILQIVQEIRRTNVAAAAATTGPHILSDPWEDERQEEQESRCTCQVVARRHSSWAGPRSPTRKSTSTMYQTPPQTTKSEENSSLLCPTCGRKRPLENDGFAWARPKPFRYHSSSTLTSEQDEEPQHAKLLLETTPQLRFLTPDSTDMNGAGHSSSRNLLHLVLPPDAQKSKDQKDGGMEYTYKASLIRDRANQLAATELANLLWTLAHEMSLEDYGAVESQVFTSVFALVHDTAKEARMAGLSALDALLAAPSADEEKKAIKFANTLSNGLRAAHGDYEFLSAVSKALGHMATRTANVDFVESEVTRALEWLRTERSDRR